LDNEIILTNHQIAAEFLGTNRGATSLSSCGVTSQAIMNLLLGKIGNNDITHVTIRTKWWDENLLRNHNIISVRMGQCSCCSFPGHAFVIYCSNDSCAILQSFRGYYTINDFFDIMSRYKVNKFMNLFLDMYINGINDISIKQLSKFTHVCLDAIRNCKLENSKFEVLYYVSNIMFKH